jgi:hypothetical protein
VAALPAGLTRGPGGGQGTGTVRNGACRRQALAAARAARQTGRQRRHVGTDRELPGAPGHVRIRVGPETPGASRSGEPAARPGAAPQAADPSAAVPTESATRERPAHAPVARS